MSNMSNLAVALYQGSWLPCRILVVDEETGRVQVQVTDRTGVHEVWLESDQVRGR